MSQSASITLLTSAELEKIIQYRPNLRPGDKIEAKVVDLRKDGKAVLDFGKFQAAVELKFPVKEGDVIQLEVVETGKQLKLKVEQPEQRIPQEIKNLIKPADLQQEKAIEELQSKIHQLLQKERETPGSTETTQRTERLLKDINNELGKLKEQLQASETRDAVPKEVKNDVENLLKNLDNVLKKISGGDTARISERLEVLAESLRSLRSGLEAPAGDREIAEIRDNIVKQITQLKAEVEQAALDPAIRKEAEAAAAKLADAAEKIGQLKSQDQLPELRRIVSEEISPRLAELQETILRQEALTAADKNPALERINHRIETLQKEIETVLPKEPPTSREIDGLLKAVAKALDEVSVSDRRVIALQQEAGSELIKLKEQFQALESREEVPKEIKSEVEYLLKNAANALRKAPEAAAGNTGEMAEKLEVLAETVKVLRTAVTSTREFHELRDQVVEQVSQLKALLEESGIPMRKEVEILVAKLSDAAQQVSRLKSPDQLPELQRVITREIEPDLAALRQALDQEVVVQGSEKYRLVNQLDQQAEILQKTIETAVQKISAESATAADAPRDMEVLLKEVAIALNKFSDTLEVTRYFDTAVLRGRGTPPPPPPSPEAAAGAEALKQDIAVEMARIREQIQPDKPGETTANREAIPVDARTRQEIETLFQQAGTSLKQVPDTPEAAERLMELARAITNLRTTLETTREFQDVREQMVREINRLNAQVKNLDPEAPARKEIEAIVTKLTQAAEKVSQLRDPQQLPELRRLIADEIEPALTRLQETLAREAPAPATREDRALAEMRRQVEIMQRDVDHALRTLPEEPPRDTETVIKDVEIALNKIAQFPKLADIPPPQFSESIQTLYDNVKAALRLLLTNLQASGQKLEIPPEIQHIFQNLQSGLKLNEVADNITQQLTQLRALVQNSELPYQRITEEIMNNLDSMLARLVELKAQQRYQDLQSFVQNQLKPFLKSVGDIFSNPKLIGEMDNPHTVTRVTQAVRSLQAAAEGLISKGAEPSLELSQLTELSQKLAQVPKNVDALNPSASQATAGAKASESIANLSKNIEALLARYPERLPEASAVSETAPAGSEAGDAALTNQIRTLLANLKSHFEPLDIGESALKLLPRLKSLVEDSGIFFEKKLNDIIDKLSEASARMRSVQTLDQLPEIRTIIEKDMKPNLLQLREFLNNEKIASQLGEQKTLDSIRHTVEELVSNISGQQSRAVEQQTQQNPVQMFSFQIPIKGEENPAELKVFYNRGRKKESPEEFKLSLFLDMDRIGEIRSDFFQLKEDLNITFYVKNDHIKEFFEDHLHEVEEALEPVFETLNLSVVVSAKKIAEFEAEEREAEIISEKAVNVKV